MHWLTGERRPLHKMESLLTDRRSASSRPWLSTARGHLLEMNWKEMGRNWK